MMTTEITRSDNGDYVIRRGRQAIHMPHGAVFDTIDLGGGDLYLIGFSLHQQGVPVLSLCRRTRRTGYSIFAATERPASYR